MKNLLITLCLAVISLTSFGQAKKGLSRQAITAACDSIMRTFGAERYSDAMEMLKAISVIEPAKVDTLAETMVMQMTAVADIYGKVLSQHFVSEKPIKDFLAKRLYIMRLEKYYLKFSFVIYKGSEGWVVTSFVYNEDISDLF